jgi:creatinine amidohydrolase
MLNHLLPTSTTEDERQTGASVAVLPIGSFEQHGRYLPLVTDTAIAVTICRELAAGYPFSNFRQSPCPVLMNTVPGREL